MSILGRLQLTKEDVADGSLDDYTICRKSLRSLLIEVLEVN